MEADYNFRQDFFDTYQSLSDWIKFAWLAIPPLTILSFVALYIQYQPARKRMENEVSGKLIYNTRYNTYDPIHPRSLQPVSLPSTGATACHFTIRICYHFLETMTGKNLDIIESAESTPTSNITHAK